VRKSDGSIRRFAKDKRRRNLTGSETLCEYGSNPRENRESPRSPETGRQGPCREVSGRKTMMNEHGQSDSSVVSAKLPNKIGGKQ